MRESSWAQLEGVWNSAYRAVPCPRGRYILTKQPFDSNLNTKPEVEWFCIFVCMDNHCVYTVNYEAQTDNLAIQVKENHLIEADWERVGTRLY